MKSADLPNPGNALGLAVIQRQMWPERSILAQRRGRMLLRELIAADRLRRRNEFREVKAQFRKLGIR
jgi:hypothetical protein